MSEGTRANRSLRVVVVGREFLLAESDVLLDAVAEAAAAARDVADHAAPAASASALVEREALEAVVLDRATHDLDDVAVDRLDEAVVVAAVRHRHEHLQPHQWRSQKCELGGSPLPLSLIHI